MPSWLQVLLEHVSTSRFMTQFLRCNKPGCLLDQCGPRRETETTPTDRFFAKFGGQFPTPVPQFADMASGTNPVTCAPKSLDLPSDVREFDGPGPSVHYKNFSDLLLTRVGSDWAAYSPDGFYDGAMHGKFCPHCPYSILLSSDAAANRHRFLAHDDLVKRVAVGKK